MKEGGRVFPQVKLSKVRSLPFRTIDFELKEDVNAYARLTSLVTSMLSLHTRLTAEQLPQRREQLQREINATDRQIDQLVYQSTSSQQPPPIRNSSGPLPCWRPQVT